MREPKHHRTDPADGASFPKGEQNPEAAPLDTVSVAGSIPAALT